jgi:hypothetical protein
MSRSRVSFEISAAAGLLDARAEALAGAGA